MSWHRRKAEASHQGGQDHRRLDRGEPGPDANARTAPERQKGVARTRFDALRRESVRIESVRIVPKLRIAVQGVHRNVNASAGRDRHAAEFRGYTRLPPDSRCRWEQPHRLLYDLAAVRKS